MNYLRSKLKGVKNRVKVACFTLIELPVVNRVKIRIFTLIELLVVIAIIGVLVGLLLPAYNMVRAKGKIVKAKSEMNAIITAIKAYETTYGLLPVIGDTEVIGGTAEKNKYDILMMFLTQVNTSNEPLSDGSNNLNKDNGNTRKVNFLDSPSDFADTMSETAGSEKGSYRDPWGNRYVILMDKDYNGLVADPDTGTLNGSVFVYSFGPNKTNEDGNHSGDEDDITTWD